MAEASPRSVHLRRPLVGVLLAVVATGDAWAGEARALEGTYTRESRLAAASSEGHARGTVVELLDLRADGQGGLVFAFTRRVGGKATCSVAGEAEWTGRWFEYREPAGARASEACVLRLVPTPLDLTLRDVGPGCGGARCDDGGRLDGIRFRRGAHPPRAPR